MPSYTLIILGQGREVRTVQEIHTDTNEAARQQAQAIFQQHSDGAVRLELWRQDERIWAEPAKLPG